MPQTISISEIRKLCIIAIASDEELMESLVLKGGNAVDFWQPSREGRLSRTSYDLDFSIMGDFDDHLDEISIRMGKAFTSIFSENGIRIFDFSLVEQPKIMHPALQEFWGGYFAQFKLITDQEFLRLGGDIEKMRRGAIKVRPDQSTKVQIDISKYEYVGDKREMNLDGYSFYIYSPEMIVLEKLRAICQQAEGYKEIVPSHSPRPRARDFYDISLICEQHPIDCTSTECRELAAHIFSAKKVPLNYISIIKAESEIHRQEWQNVLDTLGTIDREEVKGFAFYLDFVVGKFAPLTSQ